MPGSGSAERGRDAAELTALLALPPVPPGRTLRYGPHPSQVVDLYGPPGRLTDPRVVVLHGGFWREAYDRTHLTPFAAALAAAGLPVALVEYRRVGGGGGYPETFEDVTTALAAVPGDRPHVLLGHSAGGQLALWAAARTPPGPLSAVVAVAPVCDLAAAHTLRLGAGAVSALLGDDGTGSVLPGLDPLRLPAPPCPVTLLHGTDDGQVPFALSERYAAAHRRTGTVRLHPLDATGHYAPFTPGTPAFRTLIRLIHPGTAADRCPSTGE
ncbi:S9 family peptidase [Streptomyces sp. YIM 98790]|uniref:alpha/beta hydrolase family protein n=1 Tax=Streptomyces sp. YIM 98790 TaxID=2689077 RepID=UPI00140E17B4|nr:alpha/beta fold hydrolase [Streptomyces sp. YIM 98790]